MAEYIDKEQFREALISYTQTFNDKYTIQDPSKLFDYLCGLANLLNRFPSGITKEGMDITTIGDPTVCKGCNNRKEEMCRECCRWYMDMCEKEEE